jgi:hypothetical protein
VLLGGFFYRGHRDEGSRLPSWQLASGKVRADVAGERGAAKGSQGRVVLAALMGQLERKIMSERWITKERLGRRGIGEIGERKRVREESSFVGERRQEKLKKRGRGDGTVGHGQEERRRERERE